MKITSKGSRKIRERQGEQSDAEVRIVKPGPSRGERVVAALRGRATRKLTTDEIMKLTRG